MDMTPETMATKGFERDLIYAGWYAKSGDFNGVDAALSRARKRAWSRLILTDNTRFDCSWGHIRVPGEKPAGSFMLAEVDEPWPGVRHYRLSLRRFAWMYLRQAATHARIRTMRLFWRLGWVSVGPSGDAVWFERMRKA